MIDNILMVITVVLISLYVYESARLEKRINHLFEQTTRLAANQIEIDKKIDAVDESTGTDIYQLREELRDFKTDYGEAAIDEMRQAAKREKAWADGLTSIMSYGARYQGGGNST